MWPARILSERSESKGKGQRGLFPTDDTNRQTARALKQSSLSPISIPPHTRSARALETWGLLVVMALLMAIFMASCNGNRTEVAFTSDPATRRLAREEAERLASAVSGPESEGVLLNKDVAKIEAYVKEGVQGGRLAGLSAVMVTDGNWRSTRWYGVAKEMFAKWAPRYRPLRAPDSTQRLLFDALASIAKDEKSSRNAKIYAAVALRHDDRSLAKMVLRTTYADYEIGEYESIYWPIEASGPYLRELGVPVPTEVTSIDVADRLIRCDPRFVSRDIELNRSRLVGAANALNRKLHDAMVSGNQGYLEELLDRTALAEQLGDIYEKIREQGPEQQLFGPGGEVEDEEE